MLSAIGVIVASLVAACLWIPLDMLASPRSQWSPWPKWSSAVLHDVGVHTPDFDVFDHDLNEIVGFEDN
ncbi:MAG: hypothetical protein O3A29_09475 [Planctomycetota bacterium]|nr:hypothetical protein [Planctomycetota bacterium]